jgi:hypothetical protein
MRLLFFVLKSSFLAVGCCSFPRRISTTGLIPIGDHVEIFGWLTGWTVENVEGFGKQRADGLGATGYPLFVLKMRDLFGYCKVDELVEGHTLPLGEALGYSAHGGHETEGELAGDNLFLTRRHGLYPLSRNFPNTSAGVNTSR